MSKLLVWLVTCAGIAAAAVPCAFADRGPGGSWDLQPKDCQPVDPMIIDELLEAPQLEPLPECVNTLEVAWNPVDGAFLYRVDVSRHSDFSVIMYCELVSPPASSYTFVTPDPEGIFYVRAYTLVLDGWSSPPSATEVTIVDNTPPVIDSVVLSDVDSGDQNLTDQPVVLATVSFHDDPVEDACVTLWLADNPGFVNRIEREVCSSPATLEIQVADGVGRRTVYAMATDCAGQASEVRTGEITLGEKPRCYPQPFSPVKHQAVNMVFRLARHGSVKVRVYDQFSSLVREFDFNGIEGLNDGNKTNLQARWDGRNGLGSIVANGVYVCRLEGPGGFDKKIPIVVLK